jgi:hypothetical protein
MGSNFLSIMEQLIDLLQLCCIDLPIVGDIYVDANSFLEGI